jgi:GNAT superfamily N-acetyltransferase
MKVIDLPHEQTHAYYKCLEEWSPEMDDAGPLKEQWYQRMQDRGLRVKVAVDEQGTVGGMIHYGPIENVPIYGEGLYYMYCVWVHGYRQGRGNFQKKGMGRAMLQAAEEDARRLGAKGFVVWGLAIPVFMRASWFRKQGYKAADRTGMMVLLWKPFSEDAVPPKWVKPQRKPELERGKVVVTCLHNGWCPGQNMVFERARRAAGELDGKIVFREVDTFDRGVGMEWGTMDALFVDGKQVRTGPPPSYEKIRNLLQKKVRKIASIQKGGDG